MSRIGLAEAGGRSCVETLLGSHVSVSLPLSLRKPNFLYSFPLLVNVSTKDAAGQVLYSTGVKGARSPLASCDSVPSLA